MFAATNTLFCQTTGPRYDHSALSGLQSGLASGTPFTWASGAGSAGAYGITLLTSSSGASNFIPASTTPAVTWGGTTMTSLGFVNFNNVATNGWAWVFILPSILAGGAGIPGGSQTISATLTESGKTFTGHGSSYSYGNVTSIGTLQTAFGNSTSPSVAVTAANSTDLVWGAVVDTGAAISSFSLPNIRQSAAGSPIFDAGDATHSTSVTISATITSAAWAALGLDLK